MLSFFASEMVDAVLGTVTAGSYSNGIFIPGGITTSNIKIIAPQPISANEKQMLPSGELERNYLKTWTESEITGWDAPDPDQIQIGGKLYKIMMIENRATLGNYYKLTIYEDKLGDQQATI